MSLLDDASIVVTPNGYKQGVLFSVIPSSGAADLEVTRGTAATRVDENGLVNYAEVIGGEEISCGDFECADPDAVWTRGTGWTISGGTANCIGGAGSLNLTQVALEIGKTYTVTYTVSNYSVGTIHPIMGGWTHGTYQSSNGTYTEVISNNHASANTTFYMQGKSGFVGSIDNISVKEVTRDNVPRIDYTGGGCPHILAEPQRTNVSTYSEDFSQSFYIKDSGVSVGDTNFVSPSGESNATQIEVNNNGRIYANVTSDTYASSVFIKAGTFAYFKFGGNVDLVAGTFSGGTIESFGNGWFRITKQYTGNRPFQIQAYPDGTYSSHTTDGNYYIWGSQIEVGSYPTSLIPTSGSTVTRNQDIFTRDGIGSLINSQEGVLFVEMAALSDDLTRRKITISDGTSSNFCSLYFDSISNRIIGRTTVGGVLQSYLITSSYTEINFNKIAIKWKENDFALWVNGTEVGVDSSGVTWGSGVLTEISLDNGVGGESFYGKVKQLQVYESALTDDQLSSLTK